MSGVVPLSPVVIMAWANVMDIGTLHPMEVEAMLLFDSDLSFPEDETSDEDDSILPVETPSWPTRKG